MTDYEYTVLRQSVGMACDCDELASRGFWEYITTHEKLIRGGYITLATAADGFTYCVLTPKGEAALRVTVAA